MNSEVVISLQELSKVFRLYKNNNDRLREAFHPMRKKYHKKFTALKDINLDIIKGEVLGIIGRNGSGKSTLLKIISGVMSPTSGKVQVSGKIASLLELGSGFNPEFTGLQNIYFRGSLMGYNQKEMKSKEKEIIEFSEIKEHIDQPVRTYSSGMRSRLAFSVETTIQPDVFILDEVLSVGDRTFQKKALSRIEKLIHDKNITVLFVSHEEESIMRLCSSVILLNKGEKVKSGKPEEVLQYYKNSQIKN